MYNTFEIYLIFQGSGQLTIGRSEKIATVSTDPPSTSFCRSTAYNIFKKIPPEDRKTIFGYVVSDSNMTAGDLATATIVPIPAADWEARIYMSSLEREWVHRNRATFNTEYEKNPRLKPLQFTDNLLSTVRETTGLSQAEFAKKVGISTTLIAHFEEIGSSFQDLIDLWRAFVSF